MSQTKNVKKNEYLFRILLFCFFFTVQEFVFRILFPLPEIKDFNRIQYSALSNIPKNEAPFLMNSSFRWDSAPDHATSVQNLNLYGFRSSTNWNAQKTIGQTRIAFYGDSFVEGLLAKDNETLPYGYQQESIIRGQNVDVLNLGISGTSVPDYFPLIRDTVQIFQPDVVVWVITAGDIPPPDFQKSWLNTANPTYSKENKFIPRFIRVAQRFIQKQVVPTIFRSPEFAYFQPVPSPSNPFSERKSDTTFIDSEILQFMKKGLLNPFLVDYISSAESSLKQPSHAETHIQQLAEFLRSHNIRLKIVYFPHSLQISDDYLIAMKKYSHPLNNISLTKPEYQMHAQQIHEICNKVGVPFLDLTPSLKAAERNGHKMYWDYDGHPRPEAYLMAGKLAAQLN